MNSPSPGPERRAPIAVIGCGALAVDLGLDRHPELLTDYFGNYEQVAWLAVRRTADLARAAARVAARLGLPLAIIDCGSEHSHLEESVAALLTPTSD